MQGPCTSLVADLGARNGTAQIWIFPPVPACGRWDREQQGPVDLSNLCKGSDWESSPAIAGKIRYSAGQEKKTLVERTIQLGRVFSFLGFQGRREAFGYDQNYSPMAGQAWLCLAWLLYKDKVAPPRGPLAACAGDARVTSGTLAPGESLPSHLAP